MNGYVSAEETRIPVVLLLPEDKQIEIEFVIDTGYEGGLTLPSHRVAELNLPFYQRISASLADDSARMVDVYRAGIVWQGRVIYVAVIAKGQRPLLGTALLHGNDIHIHFEEGGPLSVTAF